MEGAWAEVRGARRERVGSKVVFIFAVCWVCCDVFVCLEVLEGLPGLLFPAGMVFVRVVPCCDGCARNVTVRVLTFPRVAVAEATTNGQSSDKVGYPSANIFIADER